MEQLKHQKPTELIPPPNNKVLGFMYSVAAHVSFDIVMNTLILINMVPIILELASDDDAPYIYTLNIINYVYCTIYVTEAIWKVSGFSFVTRLESCLVISICLLTFVFSK